MKVIPCLEIKSIKKIKNAMMSDDIKTNTVLPCRFSQVGHETCFINSS